MTSPEPSSLGDRAAAVLPERRRGRRRGRGAGLADPGVVMLAAGAAVLVVAPLAVWVGWTAVLLGVLLVQVVAARAWVAWLEVPAAALCSAAVVLVAVVTDVGVLVARASTDPVHERADGLDQLAPGLGAVFLAAVAVQLLRRDDDAAEVDVVVPAEPADVADVAEPVEPVETVRPVEPVRPVGPRPGAVAGIVAVSTGGAVAVGLALWLPMLASRAGASLVVTGTAFCGAIAVVLGTRAWVRATSVPPAAVLVPVLLAGLAGPFYVVGRLAAG